MASSKSVEPSDEIELSSKDQSITRDSVFKKKKKIIVIVSVIITILAGIGILIGVLVDSKKASSNESLEINNPSPTTTLETITGSWFFSTEKVSTTVIHPSISTTTVNIPSTFITTVTSPTTTTTRISCSSTQFWTGSTCSNKYANGTVCAATYQCQDYNGLSCTNSVCQCSPANYWNGSVCTSKLGNWGSCTQSYQCQHWLGLTCRWTRCTCPMHQYWTSSGCQNLPSPPWYYNASSNIYYSVQLTPTDFNNSQAWCNAYSGNLFTIQTTPDLTLLQNVYNNQIRRNFYVGAYAAVGFDFRWLSTNVSVPSRYWCQGEPNCGQPCEPCTLAGWCSAYNFNDIICSYKAPFLCERR